jgi:hypothetical protein
LFDLSSETVFRAMLRRTGSSASPPGPYRDFSAVRDPFFKALAVAGSEHQPKLLDDTGKTLSGTEGKIEVIAAPGDIVIDVIDNGIGLPKVKRRVCWSLT